METPDTFQYELSLRIVKALNVLLMTLPFAICWYTSYADGIASPFYARGNYLIIALFAVLYFIYGRVYDAFWISMNSCAETVYSQGLASLISDAVLYLVIWLLTKHLPNPLPLVAVLAGQVVLSWLWSLSTRWWYFSKWLPRSTAIVYDQRDDMEFILRDLGLEKKYQILLKFPLEEALEKDLSWLEGLDAVFLCGINSHDRNQLLKKCINMGVTAYVTPRLGDLLMKNARPIHRFHIPVFRIKRNCQKPEYMFIKRLMDIVVSVLALLIVSPVMLIVAVTIKATDGGPVLYKQRRLTVNGREFYILKFRSMRVDAEEDGIARLSTGDADNRVTPIGRMIRAVRIDELPQLWNILKGDMTLVGPRPERPEIAKQYEQDLPEFRLRLQVKAGLTGYAQVYGKYNTTPYDKLQMDLMYIANMSLAEDLRIMFATVKILFLPESTEGIVQGTVTAGDKGSAPKLKKL